jgi:uncharacterized protein
MSANPQIQNRQDNLTHKEINGQDLKKLLEASLTWLRTNQQIVNSLNVFPVPDGDTGTNMVLTMQAAFDEIKDSTVENFGEIAHTVAHGALMGARGNSGVILSQIWRGFARAVDNLPTMDTPNFVKAISEARDTAYKGVVRPVEGTILTVIKDLASKAESALNVTDDLVSMLELIVEEANASVQRTPELLPVLKEANVVDSGGKGLYFIFDGMLRYIDGQVLDVTDAKVKPLAEMALANTMEQIEPGQDFEVVVDFRPQTELDLAIFYDNLEQMGTSIQVGEGDGMYRMHIHVPTENLYKPIDYTRDLGVVTKVAIENLIDQMENHQGGCNQTQPTIAPTQPGHIAVIAVSPGVGISRVFASLGVAAIVEGGQTMNPSTQEIIHAFENLPTDKIIILPNNKNIILTAKSATELSVKKVAVVPTSSIPQGLTAMMRLIPTGDFDNVVDEMNAAIEEVQTGEITIATRSVEIDGVEVEEGQVIGLLNGKLVLSTSSLDEACLGILEAAHVQDYELITLFYGADLHKKDIPILENLIQEKYPDQEIEIQEGCQPHYHLIISIE